MADHRGWPVPAEKIVDDVIDRIWQEKPGREVTALRLNELRTDRLKRLILIYRRVSLDENLDRISDE